MDDELRRERRAEARQRVRRQRRVALGLVTGVPLVLILAVVLGGLGDSGAPGDLGGGAPRHARPRPARLPGGGRTIFPRYRVVAFYGEPGDERLGTLGVGTPAQAARRLVRQARAYRRRHRPVLPAFELIATLATGSAGDDGQYRVRRPQAVIRRYLRAARRAGALLLLDIQPGRADFLREVKVYRRFLELPDVGLALDPEWSMRAGEIPGQVRGQTDAATVNRVSAYLAAIVKRGNLPQKIFLIHQFTPDMIERKHLIVRRPGLALTINIDGFGAQANKVSKYEELSGPRLRSYHGFKLFYRLDTDLMTPRQTLHLHPSPDLIVYQ